MKILVLFDGAGLARLGLERAGHECVGVELDPVAHHLSHFVGKPKAWLNQDVEEVNGSWFKGADAVWASPPCQKRSSARTQGEAQGVYSTDYLKWSLDIKNRFPHLKYLWVENVMIQSANHNSWGTKYNAAQFEEEPRQCRNRIVGGSYPAPDTFRDYRKQYPDLNLCPCITATEYKGCATDQRRASRYYGRRLTLEECAWHMGFEIPDRWYDIPGWFEGTPGEWKQALYRAVGNGVPVPMAEAFGKAAI